MSNYPTVTGTSILERSKAFIMQMLSLQAHNEHIIAETPQNATASTWERDAPICTIHNVPKFRSLVETETLKFGEYYCSQCEQERAERHMLTLHTGKIHALFPDDGQLARRVRLSDVRHTMQDDVARDFISCLSTHKELRDTPECSELATLKRTPTNPLPARDIERAPTPQPQTPIPETRESLFADIPHTAYSIEEDDESTEKRVAVQKSSTTIHIPAIRAEMLLEALMHGEISEQSTGENERLPAKSNAWML